MKEDIKEKYHQTLAKLDSAIIARIKKRGKSSAPKTVWEKIKHKARQFFPFLK